MSELRNVHALSKFVHELKKGFRPHLDVKLNKKEVEVLSLVSRHPNSPMNKVGRIVGLERGSFTYLVDLLEAKGYVKRSEVDEDKRKKTLALTDAGSVIAEQIKEQHNIFIENKFVAYDEEERKELQGAIDVLDKLFEKLPKTPDRPRRHHKPPHHKMMR